MTATIEADRTFASEKPQLLVLAARFPSLSQPWLDTNLEQLINQRISFRIVSGLATVDRYHPKVDRLRLRDLVIPFRLAVGDTLRAVVTSFKSKPVDKGLRAYRFWRALSRETTLRSRLAAWLRALQAAAIVDKWPTVRAVHAHSINMAYDFLPIIRDTGLKLLVTYHGLKPAGVPQDPLHRQQAVFRSATCTLVNTQSSVPVVEALGAHSTRIAILPQATSLEEFPFVPSAPPEPHEQLRVITVGRFQREKGQEYGLLALRRLRDAGFDIHWTFVGVGTELPRFRRLAQRLNVDQHVTWHEGLTIDALRDEYHRSHILVVSSLAETQGVVVQEAQASGCLVVATKVGGLPYCITDGKDGFLIAHGSHRAIAETIATLFRNPDSWTPVRLAARRTVERRFAAPVIGAQFSALLATAIECGETKGIPVPPNLVPIDRHGSDRRFATPE